MLLVLIKLHKKVYQVYVHENPDNIFYWKKVHFLFSNITKVLFCCWIIQSIEDLIAFENKDDRYKLTLYELVFYESHANNNESKLLISKKEEIKLSAFDWQDKAICYKKSFHKTRWRAPDTTTLAIPKIIDMSWCCQFLCWESLT